MRALPIVIFSLFLTACATMSTAPKPFSHPLNWSVRQKQLNVINEWQIQGSIAVKTPQKVFSAAMNWQQTKSRYAINLFGPLGIGSVNISGYPGKITLRTADNQTFTAGNPEQLLQQQLGWALPVSNLYYWIRGLPVPGISATKVLDQYNHLVKLSQQGWQINYLSYTEINNVELPNKIFLNYHDLDLKIAVSQWTL